MDKAGTKVGQRMRQWTWVPMAGCIAYLCSVLVVFLRVSAETHGTQIYPLDDPYIHASIARNLILHHSYGISPGVFAAASSSVIWPFLLAFAFLLTGVHALTPLVLNIACGIAVLVLAHRLLTALAPEAGAGAALLLQGIILFGASLLSLTFVGMEHTLHCAVTLLFLLTLFHFLDRPSTPATTAALAIAAALMTGVRYEGGFVILAAGLVLLWQRRWLACMGMGVASVVLPALFGLYSRLHGGMWLPNSLIMKTAISSGPLGGLNGYERGLFSDFALWYGISLPWLLCVALLLASAWLGLSRNVRILLFIAALVTVEHAQFSRLNWGYRYEGYLVVLLAVACITAIASARPARLPMLAKAALLLLFACTFGFRLRAIDFALSSPMDIYLQQQQSALFVAKYYSGQHIAANDVGMVSFLSENECLDLWGLGSNEVARLYHTEDFDTDAITQLAHDHHVRVAVLYPHLFQADRSLPEGWVPIESWNIPSRHNVLIGGLHVGFYAVDPTEAPALRAHLQEFHAQLPPGITVEQPPFPMQPF